MDFDNIISIFFRVPKVTCNRITLFVKRLLMSILNFDESVRDICRRKTQNTTDVLSVSAYEKNEHKMLIFNLVSFESAKVLATLPFVLKCGQNLEIKSSKISKIEREF